MKKTLSLFLIIISIISLVGCKSGISKDQSNARGKEEISKGEILTIGDYYPFKENIVLSYEGIGNEYAEKKTFIEFVEGNRAQMKIMNPGTVFVKVLEYKNNTLTEVFSEGEFYHIENMLNANTNKNDIILKEPLEVGNSWTSADGYNKEITSVNEDIKTPSGTYEALEVTTELKDGAIQKDYYAKDIGHIASIYKDGEFEVSTLLEEINQQQQELDIVTYYPTLNDIGTAFVNQSIEFATNDSIENILEDLMKNSPSNMLIPPISKNTKINKIHLNRESWTLEVDFSRELLTDMNAGSSLEVEILKSIVNTLGKFYDVEKVYLTVEDKPYESGHLGININEYFTVDTTDTKEFNE